MDSFLPVFGDLQSFQFLKSFPSIYRSVEIKQGCLKGIMYHGSLLIMSADTSKGNNEYWLLDFILCLKPNSHMFYDTIYMSHIWLLII